MRRTNDATALAVRSFARRALPTVLLNFARVVRLRQNLQREWRYMGNSWDPLLDVRGWHDPSIVETQRGKWTGFQTLTSGVGPLGIAHEANHLSNEDLIAHNDIMAFAYALSLCVGGKDRISVLDWGGGLGHYYLLARALLPSVKFDYFCKDVPSLVAAGRQLLPEVHFLDDDDSCFSRRYDLVFASNSLQYSKDWSSILASLTRASVDYLFITRFPIVTTAPSFVVVQAPHSYGYQTEYQCWFVNRRAFLHAVGDLSLELQREFLTGIEIVVLGAPEPGLYRGFLFRPNASSRASTLT
jgi:putative methyltransferase (TIGR04325 family)